MARRSKYDDEQEKDTAQSNPAPSHARMPEDVISERPAKNDTIIQSDGVIFTGTIIHFNGTSAYGFIRPQRFDQHREVADNHGKRGKNDIFFHYSDYHGQETPYPGQEVGYEYQVTGRGPRAVNVIPTNSPAHKERLGGGTTK